MDETGYSPPDYTEIDFENPPDYHSSVSACGHVLYKREMNMQFPHTQTQHRWRKAVAELRGTVFLLSIGCTERSFSMQGADVGIAADYKSRSYVLRVRCEGYQFLLGFASSSSMLEWYDNLNRSIAISLPLECRNEPALYINPRRRRCCDQPSLKDIILLNWRENRLWKLSGQQWLVMDPLHLPPRWAPSRHSLSMPSHEKDSKSDDSLSQSLCGEKPVVVADTLWDKDSKVDKCDNLQGDLSSLPPQARSLASERQCARELLYCSKWQSKWYVRNGEWNYL